MKKTNFIILLLVVSILATALAACSGGNKTDDQETGTETKEAGSEAKTDSDNQAGDRTLSIMASQDWVKDPELELADKFTEETGITVDYQIIPSDQYPNLLTTKLNSGECADIFMHQSGKFDIVSLLQIEKNAIDLSDQEWVERFDEAVKDQVSVDGKTYGITIWDQSDSYAYIYNKEIFDRLGLEPPTTYQEFKDVCQAILDDGITPIYECVSSGWHHQLNFFDVSSAYDKADAELVDKLNDNSVKFSEQPVFAEMLNQMKEVVDSGYWGEFYMSNAYEDTAANMASGDYAMTVNMMGRIGDIVAAGGDEDNYGIFPAPYLDNQVIAETPCGPSKFIYSGSKNQDIAKQYLEFLAKQENLQYMIEHEDSFNSLPFSGLEPTYSDTMKEAIDQYKTGESTVYQNAVVYLNPQWMEIGTDITSMLMGDMTAEEVVEAIDARRADQAKAAGDPNWE